MPRRTKRPPATRTEVLECIQQQCPACGELMWNAYDNHHKVTGLEEVVHLRLKVRRCVNPECARYHVPYRPEEEGRWALPKHEFGLDVIAQIGALRYREHRTVPRQRTKTSKSHQPALAPARSRIVGSLPIPGREPPPGSWRRARTSVCSMAANPRSRAVSSFSWMGLNYVGDPATDPGLSPEFQTLADQIITSLQIEP